VYTGAAADGSNSTFRFQWPDNAKLNGPAAACPGLQLQAFA